MSTQADNKIFNLVTRDIRLVGDKKIKKYDFINTSQLYFMINDYVDITCEEISKILFEEPLNLKNNIEKVYETIESLKVNELFDAELVGPDDNTIIGEITVSRIK